MTKLTLGGILRTYLPMALAGTVAAIVIYRQIAIKEGRLAAVRGLFKRGKTGEGTVAVQPSGKEKPPVARLFSIPLIVAIVLLLALMVVNEVMI